MWRGAGLVRCLLNNNRLLTGPAAATTSSLHNVMLCNPSCEIYYVDYKSLQPCLTFPTLEQCSWERTEVLFFFFLCQNSKMTLGANVPLPPVKWIALLNYVLLRFCQRENSYEQNAGWKNPGKYETLKIFVDIDVELELKTYFPRAFLELSLLLLGPRG